MSSRDVTVKTPPTAGSLDTSLGDLVAAPHSAGSDTGPLAPGQTFGPRYHIIRLLGIGGMGAVYHAWDTELGVSVAIKVIRPEIMANPTAGADVERRFKRELVLARQVTHKNVVRIHDLGEINSIKYITMSYVNGIDLSTKLKNDGRLPVAAIMPIARAVASGLVAAHAAGVVHRDLKPANIMIGVNGETLIMDFGIARSNVAQTETFAGAVTGVLPTNLMVDAAATIAPSGGPASMAATMAGTAANSSAEGIVGTVQYMAPEQASGLPVDQRADIYAFGLILYDALVGVGTVTGSSRHQSPDGPVAELRARMQAAPPPVRTLVPEVPEALDRLISRCLDPQADKRFQTTTELEAELALLDDEGKLIPVKRVISTWTLAAVVVAATAAIGGGWWYFNSLVPLPPHDPVTVVIADFKNLTGDPTFNRTLEPVFRSALQTSSFISAYDHSAIAGAVGVRPPEVFDETAARELAAKQGLGIVLSGAINRQNNGYQVSMKAVQALTSAVVVDKKARAATKNDILGVATKLVADVRKALGDEVPESAKLLAMRSLSASSLDVMSYYAAAIEAQSRGKFEDAKQSYLKAVAIDPKFGLGYQGLAVMSRNLNHPDEAEKYIKEALKYLDGMTDRERYGTRGFYFRMIGDNQECAKDYSESLAEYPADTVAHNQRAGCLFKLRNMREAVGDMRQAVQMLPHHTGYRTNLALLEALAGDFDAAEAELKKLPQADARALQALAYSQMGRGLLQETADTYQKIEMTGGAQGASSAAAGFGDLAVYKGRFADAVRIYERGAAADLAAKSPDRAAIKLVSSAYARLMAGQPAAAVAAADQALLNSKSMPVRFLAARIFVEAGALDKAGPIAAALSAELPAEPQAHGKIIEGLIALKIGNARAAVKTLTEANTLLDTWFGHFDLGRAYLAANAPTQADSEFDRCIARRGEALSLMDEGPTYGYFPSVYYYQGRVREQMGTARFADSYREYLRIRAEAQDDPLLPDVRRRAGS